MSHYEKLVKGATKPKPSLPKEKYINPILQAAEGSSNGLQSVFRALQSRLQDSNSTVVFKALIVLHTMIRSSSATSVQSYLAGDPSAIRLRRVATNGLAEFSYSRTVTRYATYLENRIIIFRELGYDVVLSGKRDRFSRLRKLTVSKGLLQEISQIQRVMTSLLDCSFLAEEQHDELTMAAFQMILKDLMTFYMGMNEGIINMLEHYFEMSKPEAEHSLELYRRFCFQTENVLAFLDSTKKHSYQLRSAIPNLKHAPLSLANALEEYLHETDFSSHASKDKLKTDRPKPAAMSEKETKISTLEPAKTAPTQSSKQALQDFFEALEKPDMPFNNAYGAFSTFQAQPDWFGMNAMPTGGPAAMQPAMTGGVLGAAPTGFMQPNMTGFNPFAPQPAMTPMYASQPVHMMPTQPLAPQHTMATTPFDTIFGSMSSQPTVPKSAPLPPQAPSSTMPSSSAQPPATMAHTISPVDSSSKPSAHVEKPPTSKVSFAEETKTAASMPHTQSIKPQKTGSMNPFSIPSDFEEPKVEKPPPARPTLNELAMQAWTSKNQPAETTDQPAVSSQTSTASTMRPQPTGLLGSVASEFVKPQAPSTAQVAPSHPTTMSGTNQLSLSPQSTGTKPATLGTQAFSVSPQHTGFALPQAHMPASSSLTRSQSLMHGMALQNANRPSLDMSRFGTDGVGLGISQQTTLSPSSGMLGSPSAITGSMSTPMTGSVRSNSMGLDASKSSLAPHFTGLDALRPGLASHTTGLDTQRSNLTTQLAGLSLQPTGQHALPTSMDLPRPGNGSHLPQTGVEPRGMNFLPHLPSTGLDSRSMVPSSSQFHQDSMPSFSSRTGSLAPDQMSSMELQAQITGLTGIKPFQPSSSFGTSIMHGNVPNASTSSSVGMGSHNTVHEPPTQDLLQL
ncbi:anth-domain-containing protein [Malassezia pachydermatis]|uniref:Anth-domain-containing protein n=1 Tax=Malassezia pachydermatis TaxID=77020 RepID=A0A0M8MWC8_9BASI|nr:anth-domain-containing protein [Malassezia pachydermatis]KOS15624.1 anth-domain-containing protein [Malassezia pachydermatis]